MPDEPCARKPERYVSLSRRLVDHVERVAASREVAGRTSHSQRRSMSHGTGKRVTGGVGAPCAMRRALTRREDFPSGQQRSDRHVIDQCGDESAKLAPFLFGGHRYSAGITRATRLPQEHAQEHRLRPAARGG